MIRDEKNISDKKFSLDLALKDKTLPPMSYTKSHKLITALYMVTDIMDKEEPLRNKLRTLGIELLSDISTVSKTVLNIQKIDQAMSFLEISSAMNFISEMNCSILKKEFLELKVSIQESTQIKPIWLEEFLNSPLEEYSDLGRREVDIHPVSQASHPSRGESNPKGHTRIGVQKGSTLMKALSDKTSFMSDRNNSEARPNTLGLASRVQDFDLLKKQRRNEIVSIIKTSANNTDPALRGATITDIKSKAQGVLVSCGEKTLQRELISMVKDGVLYKTGEKRWSRYFIK